MLDPRFVGHRQTMALGKINSYRAVEIGEYEAEQRMRAKAMKAYCFVCPENLLSKCRMGKDSCIMLKCFIEKLNENEDD